MPISTAARRFSIAIAADPQGFKLGGVGIERREQPAGGLLQAAVRIGFQVAYIARQVQRRLTAETPAAPANVAGEKPSLCRPRSLPAFTRWRTAPESRLRRESRTHAQLPLLLHRREGFTRQVQAADGGIHLTIAKALLRANRHKQRAARAGAQMHRRYFFSPFKLQQTAGGQRNVEGLRLIGQIAEIQRQASVSPLARKRGLFSLGNNRRRLRSFFFPRCCQNPQRSSLGHNPQFAVKVANREVTVLRLSHPAPPAVRC